MRKMNIPLMGAVLGTVLAALGALAIAGTYKRTGAAPVDFRQELRYLYAHYRQETKADVAGVIRVYDGADGRTLKEENTFRFIRHGAQYYSQLSYIQTFVSDSLVVELDTVNEYMVVSRPQAGAIPALALMLPDSLLNATARFQVRGHVSARDDERMLTLTSDYNPEIRSFTLTYDTATYRVSRATIAWWKAGTADADTSRVWQTSIDYRYQPFSELNMSERIRRIVTIRKNQVVPATRYSAYAIYNQIDKP